MRHAWILLTLAIFTSGCSLMINGEGMGEALAPVLGPPLAISTASLAYRDEHGHWPKDCAVLEFYCANHEPPIPLPNFDALEFEPMLDGSLHVEYVAPFGAAEADGQRTRGSLVIKPSREVELSEGTLKYVEG